MIYKHTETTKDKSVTSSVKIYVLLLLVAFVGLVAQVALFGPTSETLPKAGRDSPTSNTHLEAPDIKVSVAPVETLDLAPEKDKNNYRASEETPQAPTQPSPRLQSVTEPIGLNPATKRDASRSPATTQHRKDPKEQRRQNNCFRLLGLLCVL